MTTFPKQDMWLIQPGVGVGSLRLGMTIEEVNKLYPQVEIVQSSYSTLEPGIRVRCYGICDNQVVEVYLYRDGTNVPRIEGPDGINFDTKLNEAEAAYAGALQRRDFPPTTILTLTNGISLYFSSDSGEMQGIAVAFPPGPDLDAEREKIVSELSYEAEWAFEQIQQAVYACDGNAIEGLRDAVTDHDLYLPLLILWKIFDSWEQRAELVQVVQDRIVPEWRPYMLDFLRVPICDDDFQYPLHTALAIAITHVEGSFDAFDRYWNDLAVAKARAAELRAGEKHKN